MLVKMPMISDVDCLSVAGREEESVVLEEVVECGRLALGMVVF